MQGRWGTTVARVPRRAAHLLNRLRWLSPLVGGPLAAFGLLMRMRSNPEGLHTVRYASREIRFRSRDERAIKEVIADRDYVFLMGQLCTSSSPLILDVGAHVGSFALYCLGQAPKARILSVEANPATYAVLQENARRWSSAGATLRVEHAAAGAHDGETLKIGEYGGSSMSDRVDDGGALSASSLSLPSLATLCSPKGEDIDLAKIDIEGSEEALICNHPETLQRIKAMVIELHPDLCDAERVRSMLHHAYPSVVEIRGRISSKPLLYCRRDLYTST